MAIFAVPQKADALIIGAGPVGLWTAIQMKELRPETEIHILERFTEYQRHQTLRLSLSALDNPEIRKRITQLITKGEARYYQKKSPALGSISANDTVEIPIQVLEKCLEAYALEKGVIIKRDIKLSAPAAEPAANSITPEELVQAYPGCKVFIGTDGSHSMTRQGVFGKDEDQLNVQEMQYVVEFKYKASASEKSKKLDYSRYAYATEKLAGFRCDETIKVDENKKEADVSLRFIVDKNTYDALGEASYKKPLTQFDNLPLSLKKALSVWMNAREHVAGEKYQEGSGKLNKITLSVYHSKGYSKTYAGRSWFLVGDAAIGVPYFAALKCGLRCSSKLAKLLTTTFEQAKEPTAVMADYEHHMQTQLKFESKTAKEKNMGLEAWKLFVKTSASVPWQMNRWWGSDLSKIQKAHAIFQADLQEVADYFEKALADATPTPHDDAQRAKKKQALYEALKNLKTKTLGDLHSGNQALDLALHQAKTLSREAASLAAAVADNSINENTVQAFHQATAGFRTTWSWRTVLAAVVGAAIGFIVGAMIGMVAGPGAALTAVYGGAKGAVLGASLFAAGGGALGVGVEYWARDWSRFALKTETAAKALCKK